MFACSRGLPICLFFKILPANLQNKSFTPFFRISFHLLIVLVVAFFSVLISFSVPWNFSLAFAYRLPEYFLERTLLNQNGRRENSSVIHLIAAMDKFMFIYV